MNAKDAHIRDQLHLLKSVVSRLGIPQGTSAYRYKLAELEKWLANFEASEVSDAATLLSNFKFVRDDEVRGAVGQLSGMLRRLLGADIRDTAFFQLGNSPSDSGGNFLYDLRRELKLDASRFPQAKPIHWLAGKGPVVFIDDIIGSGNQATKYSIRNVGDRAGRTIYCALYGFEAGIRRVRSKGRFSDTMVAVTLTNADRAFHASSSLPVSAEQRERLRALALKYGKQLYPPHPLGYENSQALIAFAHNTPNNTLPIIWAGPDSESTATRNWHPAFRRVKTQNLAKPFTESKEESTRADAENTVPVSQLDGAPTLPAADTSRPRTKGNVASAARQEFVLSDTTVLAAFTLLLCEQYADGSWGRTLHRASGRAFTTDVTSSVGNRPVQKKAVSITSWGAQGCQKIAGVSNLSFLHAARQFILSHQNRATSEFGNVYHHASGAPLVGSDSLFVANPRHTATAVKMLEEYEGLSPSVNAGSRALVALECEAGGWGERRDAPPNSLTTAYVIDCLTKIQKRPSYKTSFGVDEWDKMTSATLRGYTWLAAAQGTDGMWSYEGQQHFAPFYTANVLAFSPDLFRHYPEKTRKAISALLAARRRGVVEYERATHTSISSTALLAFALIRINRQEFGSSISELIMTIDEYFLGLATAPATYTILDAMFTVALASVLATPVTLKDAIRDLAEQYSEHFKADSGHDGLSSRLPTKPQEIVQSVFQIVKEVPR